MTYGIVITAIGQTKKVEIALRTIRPYARKVGAEVVVIDQPRLAINGPGGYNYLNFEKFQVADCFDIFDRILRLDSDVLINPEAPNIFEETEDASFAAVMEDHGSRAAQRRKEVQRLAHRFSVPAWHKDYFNSGVVVANREVREAFVPRLDLTPQNLRDLGPFKEQSLLNLQLHWLNVWQDHDVQALDRRWNRMRAFVDIPKSQAYILHYAGPKDKEQRLMMEQDIKALGWG